MTKFVSSSLIGMWLLTGSPSFWAAHCSQRCFSIFLPLLISVRWTVAVLLQLSHFIRCLAVPLARAARPPAPVAATLSLGPGARRPTRFDLVQRSINRISPHGERQRDSAHGRDRPARVVGPCGAWRASLTPPGRRRNCHPSPTLQRAPASRPAAGAARPLARHAAPRSRPTGSVPRPRTRAA